MKKKYAKEQLQEAITRVNNIVEGIKEQMNTITKI